MLIAYRSQARTIYNSLGTIAAVVSAFGGLYYLTTNPSLAYGGEFRFYAAVMVGGAVAAGGFYTTAYFKDSALYSETIEKVRAMTDEQKKAFAQELVAKSNADVATLKTIESKL